MKNNKTNQIIINLIEKIEKAGKWDKCWVSNSAYNPITKKYYKGINTLLLQSGNYATFKQIKKAGGSVKKGSKSKKILFMAKIEDEYDKDKSYFCNRCFSVFNINDCENMEEYKANEKQNDENEITNDETLNTIINNYTETLGGFVKNSSSSFYSPKSDIVSIPKASSFKNSSGYYETVFHELAHSTGHKSRLNRIKNMLNYTKKSKEYQKEELVAEFGAMLCLKGTKHEEEANKNILAYIKSWSQNIKDKPKEFLSALSQANKAKDLIFNT